MLQMFNIGKNNGKYDLLNNFVGLIVHADELGLIYRNDFSSQYFSILYPEQEDLWYYNL